MLATKLEKFLTAKGIHYAWFMAFISFILLIFSSSAMSTPAILMLPIIETFGWSITEVSAIIGALFIIVAVAAPFGTAFMLRLGLTKIVVISCGLLISGLSLTTFAFEKWHLFFSIGTLLGLASGILGLGFAATVATRWFVEKRGLVMGILAASWAAGQILLVPFIAWIVSEFNWQYGVVPGVSGAVVCLILFVLFGKNWPSDLGLMPYGAKTDPNIIQNGQERNPIKKSFSVLFNCSKHPGFWILSSTFFICGFTSNGLVSQHFIPFCADNNIGIVVASSYLAIIGLFNFIGSIGSGWLADKFDNYKLLAAFYSVRGLSLVYLPFSSLDIFYLTLWAIFFGLDFIATIPPTGRFCSKFFGSIDGPIAFAWIFSIHQIGAASAAYGAGRTRDIFLTYEPVFLVAGIACFIATVLLLGFRLTPQSQLTFSS